jgi:G3E family GTPase
MDLVKQLQDIIALHRFDYIVIEASGICEPEPIAQTICEMARMAPEVTKNGIPYVDCIVTVVDALRMKDEFDCGSGLTKKDIDEEDIENLVIQQIEFCNIILLNKAAEVEPRELERIRQIVRGIQKKAQIIDCNYGDVELDKLLNTNLFDYEKVATSATWIAELEQHHDDDDDDDDDEHEHEHHHHKHEEHHHDHEHHHHHHHDHDEGEAEEYGIGTFVYYRRKPMRLSEFDQFVARLWPKGIIRAKGICYFKGEEDVCYLFEQAGKQVKLQNIGQWYATMPAAELEAMKSRDANLRRDWDDTYGDRMQKLVFIGQHLDKEAITTLLDACLTE